jgi:AcrR family transcriptional regulator
MTATAIGPWAAVEPETSRRMLLGAIDAFAERGYHATTTRDIAARAGLSPAALYVHYPSKAALLAQISTVGHEAALALVERAVTRADEPVGALRAVVCDFVAWHAEHHLVARVVQYELAALPDTARAEVAALRRRIEGLVESLLAAGVAAGVMQTPDARRVARAILSLGIDVARWYDPAGRDSPGQLGALYADLAARMVGAHP